MTAAPSTSPPAAADLAALVTSELARPAGSAAETLAAEIRRRHGDCVAAVLFYGSCLRRQTAEGVLDFYVLVDDYRAAHGSRLAAAANALLPPNVLWLEHQTPAGEALACKYAVMTVADFAAGAGFEGVDGRVWARFCQPSVLLWSRDEAVARAVHEAVAEAVCTLVRRMLPFMPVEGPTQRFTSGDLFHFGFRETYSAELRSERQETIAGLHARDPERYDRATAGALAVLAARGRAGAFAHRPDGVFEVAADPAALRRGQWSWKARRPLAKALVVMALLKTAFTQDNWVSYAIWKLERHSGQTIEVTDAQRRHPLILGWPVIFRLLRNGVLR